MGVLGTLMLLTVLTSAEEAFPFDGLIGRHAEAHDPSIFLYGQRYFAVVTSGNSFAPIKSSADLLNWTDEGPALAEQPDWLKKRIAHRSIWAPAVVKIGTKLRLYYCASEKFGSNTSVIGVAENDHFDPAKPTLGWKDLGEIFSSKAGKDNFNAIDPDVFVDAEGRHWMVYGSYWGGIYQVELDPKTGKLLHPQEKPIHVASNTKENGNPLEAPVVFRRGDYYYLFVNYGLAAQGIRSTYRLMVGRSKNPAGPFLGFDGRPMTEGGHTEVLKSSPPMFAPGGGNVFVTPDGKTMVAYHFYDGRKFWHGDLWGRPELQVRELVWGPDGWPLPALPVGATLKPADQVVGKWIHQPDFGESRVIDLKSDGTVTGTDGAGSWSLKDRILTMTWPKKDGSGERWTDTLVLSRDNSFFVGRNQAGKIIRGVRVDALP